jgi:hypothetical protein
LLRALRRVDTDGMRQFATFGAVVGVLFVVLDAAAGGDDVPAITKASAAAKPSTVHVECSRTQTINGRKRSHCSFVETDIQEPKPIAEIDKELVALDETIKKGGGDALLVKGCKEMATAASEHPLPALPAGDPSRSLQDALQQACLAKSVPQFRQAFADYFHNVLAHTCGVRVSTWEDDFDQVDANTWSANSGPVGLCKVSSISTLWRDQATTLLWNYKDVQTFAPGSTGGPLCAPLAGTTEIREFLWRNGRIRDLGCRFFDL